MTDEKTLLMQLRAGHVGAFTQLYWTYSEKLYANIFKMVKDKQTTEEILQDIFTNIWQKRETLEFNQGLGPYLYRMSQNKVIDFYRKIKRDKELLRKFKSRATEYYEQQLETIEYRESTRLLQRALELLSPQQRNVYQLCKIDGLSYKEAARQLGISTYTVKEYLSTASKAVRNYLADYFDIA